MQQSCLINEPELTITVQKDGAIQEDYIFLDPPLHKCFSEVRKAQHKMTNVMRAVKIITKSESSIEQYGGLIISLDHPNISKVYEIYQDDRFYYIVTDLFTGEELYEKIRKESQFTVEKSVEIIRQILSAVQCFHKNNIVHMDLKPENLFYESEQKNAQLKVINIGKAQRFVPNEKMNKVLGTNYYIAPEVLSRKYDEKCDIWSSGVILYILLCGYPPFGGRNEKEIFAQVKKAKLVFDPEDWGKISQEAKDFISHLLESNPSERYSASQALNDPWIQKYQLQTPTLDLSHLQHFKVKNQLQQIILKYIAQEFLSQEEKTKFHQTFQALDTDHDGKLSKDELLAILPEEQINQLLQIIGNKFDYLAFVIGTIDRQTLFSKLQEAFQLFDKNGDGYISIDELKQKFSGLSTQIWIQCIQEFDANSDGKLSFDEFSQMMRNIDE